MISPQEDTANSQTQQIRKNTLKTITRGSITCMYSNFEYLLLTILNFDHYAEHRQCYLSSNNAKGNDILKFLKFLFPPSQAILLFLSGSLRLTAKKLFFFSHTPKAFPSSRWKH